MNRSKRVSILLLASVGLFVPAHALANSFAFTTLDFPGDDYTYLTGINNSGQIVGQYGNGNGGTFLLNAGSFTPLTIPWAGRTQANGINDNGEIVGAAYSPFPLLGFKWSGGLATPFTFPFATSTNALGINNNSEISGIYTDSTQAEHGFLLSNNTFTTIDVPGATWTAPYAINDLGQLGGAYTAGLYTHGFLMSNGSFSYFDCPGPSYESTYIFGINNGGYVAGSCGSALNANFSEGFILSNGVLSRINVPGATETWVTGLNDNGQLVGFFSTAGRVGVQGFMATPVPEPATWAQVLIALGLAALGKVTKRTRS